ncbi:unnamed protein product, partial [Brassica rapa subsp. narinosa]
SLVVSYFSRQVVRIGGMDQFSGGGNWSMIPNVQAQGNFGTPTNQDHLFLQQQQQPQQFHHPQQQQTQQQFQPQQQQQEMQFQQFQQQQQFIQQQQFHHQQHRLLHSPQQPQSSLQSPPPQQTVVHTPQSMMHTPQQQQQLVHTPQQSVQTPQQHQSLASHFHLYPLVEKLSDAVETGTRDQNSDALVSELNGHFDKCQQLLNSISGSLGSKTTMTVDGQKRNLEESEQLLQQRRFMSDLEVQVPTAFDPFADANAEDAGAGAGTKEYVHIRVQQRNGRKSLTTVQGLKKEYSYTKILKDLKKEFCCNGTVVQDSELGQVIQLQGDQRKNVSTFLVQQAGLVKKDNIKIHGF